MSISRTEEKKKKTSLYVCEYRRYTKKKAVAFKGGKCQRCGYSKSVAAMDFHHRDPTEKDFSIGSDGRTRGWERVVQELGKCDLLCKNCHAEIHEEWKEASILKQKEFLAGYARNSAIDIPCSHCGESLQRVPSRMRYLHQFCNKECQDSYRYTPPKDGQNRVGKTKADWPDDSALSKLVWEIPVTSIAKSLGVSDKSVKKRCISRGIKTPGPGYWASTGR